jgi:peptide/nickel transport system permease protein
MLNYIIRRLIQAMVVLIIVSLAIFFMMHLLPGDPIVLYMSATSVGTISDQQLALLRHEFGLDQPMMIQYFHWVAGFFHGNFGKSIIYDTPVSTLLIQTIPVTLNLGILAFIFANALGIIAGIISAVRRAKTADTLVTVGANIGITIPVFWLGIMLIYLFGLKLRWLPTQGYVSPGEDLLQNIKHLIMPVFCVGIFVIGACARQVRSSMLEVIHQDFIRTAWSKGLTERRIISGHVLKNALIPVITLMGMHLATILGGAVLIETVFNIPGLGRLAVNSLLALDYPIVQGITVLMALMVVITNLIVDVSYGLLDPRIRYI